jgi:hypothetical protein
MTNTSAGPVTPTAVGPTVSFERMSSFVLLSFFLRVACGFAAMFLSASARAKAQPAPAESGAHYASKFGESYRTKVDLYLFFLNGDFDSLFLGCDDGSRGTQLEFLPAKVGAENVGKSFGAAMILDVVPAGSEFTLMAETHDVTLRSGIRDQGGYPMGFIATLNFPKDRRMDGVRCEFIQSAKKAPPRTLNQTIAPTFAELIPRGDDVTEPRDRSNLP